MASHHYRLLTLERGELRGPLAAFADERSRHSLAGRALRALSKVKPGGINVLGLRAGVGPNGEFWFRPTGLLAGGLGRRVADSVNHAVLRKGAPLLRRGDSAGGGPVRALFAGRAWLSRWQTGVRRLYSRRCERPYRE